MTLPEGARKLSKEDKVKYYEKQKKTLLSTIRRREIHREFQNSGNPVSKQMKTCLTRIKNTRKVMEDISKIMRPRPRFDHLNDDACLAELYAQNLIKRKSLRVETAASKPTTESVEEQAILRNTANSVINLVDDSDNSEYVEKHLNSKGKLGASSRSIGKSTSCIISNPTDQQMNGAHNPIFLEDGGDMEVERLSGYALKRLPNPDMPSGYPRYDSGDVVIILCANDVNFQYQLHEDILRYNSARFDSELNKEVGEPCELLKYENTWARKRFGLRLMDNREWRLVRSPFTLKISNGRRREAVKAELPEPPSRILDMYNNLFMIFYGDSANIETNDLCKGFEQSFDLVKLSQEFMCQHLVMASLRRSWELLGQGLIHEIITDPPRWLNLGSIIHSTMIVCEALIHIVALYPEWPWPTSQDTLEPQMMSLVKKKVSDLWDKQTKAILELTLNTVELVWQTADGSTLIEPPKLEAGDTPFAEDWLVGAVWQDWFSQQRLKFHNKGLGTLFRIIAYKQDCYLQEEDVRAQLRIFQGANFGTFQIIAKQLEFLKIYAQERAFALAQNYSKIHIEELENLGIGYLTCTNVEQSELPWGQQQE